MANPATSLILMLLTLLTVAAAGRAWRRLRQGDAAGSVTAQHAAVAVVALSAGGLFVYHWLAGGGRWQPLSHHLHGLLLMAALLAGVILFFQLRPRLFGLSAFALPLLALVLAWAVCAAAWTYRPFHLASLHPAWQIVHLAGVYLGTASAAIAAIAGGMYLYVQRRLKRKANLRGIGRLASLERLETLIIRGATLGFALLTLGLLAGLVILVDRGAPVELAWWYSPKIVIATLAWLVYALLMNIRHTTFFRGPRAAWLSITGLGLLLTTYALVTALSADSTGATQRAGATDEPMTRVREPHRTAPHAASGNELDPDADRSLSHGPLVTAVGFTQPRLGTARLSACGGEVRPCGL